MTDPIIKKTWLQQAADIGRRTGTSFSSYLKNKPVSGGINIAVAVAAVGGSWAMGSLLPAPAAVIALCAYGGLKAVTHALDPREKMSGRDRSSAAVAVPLIFAIFPSDLISDFNVAQRRLTAQEQVPQIIEQQIDTNVNHNHFEVSYSYEFRTPWSWKVQTRQGVIIGEIRDRQIGDYSETYLKMAYHDKADHSFDYTDPIHIAPNPKTIAPKLVAVPEGYNHANEVVISDRRTSPSGETYFTVKTTDGTFISGSSELKFHISPEPPKPMPRPAAGYEKAVELVWP